MNMLNELGRDGSTHMTQRLSEEKSQKRSDLFKTLRGVSMLAVAVAGLGVGGLASYTYYTDTVYSPEYVEQYEKVQQIEAQKTITEQQKKAADEAIERARIETEAAQKSAQEQEEAEKPQKMLEKMFQRTDMAKPHTKPRNVELKAKFNASGTLVEFNKDYSYNNMSDAKDLTAQDARFQCMQNFSMEKFITPRGLSELPSSAHYTQLKEMWSLCRGGFVEPDLSVTGRKDGGTDVYYQLYAQEYDFGNVGEYRGYQDCMLKALDSPQIKQLAAAPVIAGP